MTVYRTVAPGIVVAAFAVLVMVSAGVSTTTWERQRPRRWSPAGQDRPGARRSSGDRDDPLVPLSGLFTVTENVTVAVAAADTLPVHVSTGLANDTVPAVAAASPL